MVIQGSYTLCDIEFLYSIERGTGYYDSTMYFLQSMVGGRLTAHGATTISVRQSAVVASNGVNRSDRAPILSLRTAASNAAEVQ